MSTTPLTRGSSLTSDVSNLSPRSLKILETFDVTPEWISELVQFKPYEKPDLPDTWGVGLIVGASGTGKSLLLAEFGKVATVRWDKSPIIEHFDSHETLAAAGLSDISAWCRPYQALSTGQQFRADLARRLVNNAVVDEYTSVVSRSVAKSASRAMRGYVKRTKLTGLVFATCHHDVEEWLTPDWVIDTDRGILRRSDFNRRPWKHQVGPVEAEIVLQKRTKRTISRR